MRIRSSIRMIWLSLLSFLLIAALAGRLYSLSVVHAAEYARAAHNQRTVSLPLQSGRGLILDREGVPLADPQQVLAVAAFLPLMKDKAGAARALSPILRMDAAMIQERLEGPERGVWLKQGISSEARDAVVAMGLPGIAVTAVTQPHGDGALARHLVGYFNDAGGQLGLEQAFDRELRGTAAAAVVASLTGRNDPMDGLGIRTAVPLYGKEPYQVETTLDAQVEAAVESVLDKQTAAGGGSFKAAVVVLNPNSGEVLAMASRPQFEYPDLEGTMQATDSGALVNRALAAYPPGSVFKPFVAAMALEQGLVSLDEPFFCSGHYDSGGLHVKEFGNVAHGWLDFKQAVAHSCNTTFLKVGEERLGLDGLQQAAFAFGFGRTTGLLGQGRSLAEEQAGNVPRTAEAGALQIAFGQGALLTTPLQVARGYAAFANGGVLPALKLVKTVRSPSGEVMARPQTGRGVRVISRETAASVREALLAVTDPDGEGTGRAAWIPGAGSAGKTGSAEKGDGTSHAWFAGYFPVDKPQYVAVVMVEGGGAGGMVAAPLFRAVGEAILASAGDM